MTPSRTLIFHDICPYLANGADKISNFARSNNFGVKKALVGRYKRTIVNAAASPSAAIRANVSFLGFRLNDPSLLPLTTESLSTDKSFSVHNPAAPSKAHPSSVVAKIPKFFPSGDENYNHFVDKAIQNSHQAQLVWKETTALYRGSLLRTWCDLIKENSEDLATIMTKESGKTLAESRGEVAYGANFVEYFSAAAISSTNNCGGGVIIPSPFTKGDGTSPRGMVMVIKEPVGVAAMVRKTLRNDGVDFHLYWYITIQISYLTFVHYCIAPDYSLEFSFGHE
jgi:hypothetical protein